MTSPVHNLVSLFSLSLRICEMERWLHLHSLSSILKEVTHANGQWGTTTQWVLPMALFYYESTLPHQVRETSSNSENEINALRNTSHRRVDKTCVPSDTQQLNNPGTRKCLTDYSKRSLKIPSTDEHQWASSPTCSRGYELDFSLVIRLAIHQLPVNQKEAILGRPDQMKGTFRIRPSVREAISLWSWKCRLHIPQNC